MSTLRLIKNTHLFSKAGINLLLQAQIRQRSSTPFNTGVLFVPQQEAWVIERMGKFNRILNPGINFLIPVLDKVKYVQSLKEIPIEIPQQNAITADNVGLSLDGVLYLRIFDAYKASYGVEDPEFAITQLAQTNMRSEIGKMPLDSVFKERESLNIMIVASINKASEAWGISCLRYEIRDVKLPSRVQEAMHMQVEAERKKRASILESEGMRESAINIAEGKRSARIMASEAEKAEKINIASGEANAIIANAEARAKSLHLISEAINKDNGTDAASFAIAEQYVASFGNLAKQSNTIILPAQTGDITSMVTQAMTIYKSLAAQNAFNKEKENQNLALDPGRTEEITSISNSNSTNHSFESGQKQAGGRRKW